MTEKHTDDNPTTEAATIADLTRAAGDPVQTVDIDDADARKVTRYFFNRDGSKVAVEQLDELEPRPRQASGVIRVDTPDALVTYANRHAIKGIATLWGDVDNRRLTVVVNDHANHELDGEPGWADHQAVLQLAHSTEWEAWAGINGKMVSQTELAEFLEEHALEVVEPDGATVLEVARTFHATTGARFKKATSLHSGEQQLVYEEDIEAKAGRDRTTEVPRDLTVALRPFVGSEAVKVDGRFRFRVRQGELTLGVKLLRLDEVIRDAVEDVLGAVADELDLEPIHGTAPSPRR